MYTEPLRGKLLACMVDFRQLAAATMFGLLAAFAGGCGAKLPSHYTPSEATAQQALTAALDAWKAGRADPSLELADPPLRLQVADSYRRAGQRLKDFEILGEISADGPRSYEVRLDLENPTAVEEARYYLVGIDPLWVFRDKDYTSVMHWDACAEEPSDGQQVGVR